MLGGMKVLLYYIPSRLKNVEILFGFVFLCTVKKDTVGFFPG